jgi:LysR family transcriptional regulator, low CO2-responsive transcriptional regulator
MNLAQLRTLKTVADLGSYSRAAEALYLSQPAVYLQVRALERATGHRLIEQVGRRATPTAAGQLLLRYAAQILDLTEEAQAALADRRPGEVIGHLALITGSHLNHLILPFILRAYRARHPNVRLDLQALGRQQIGDLLLRREADLGILIGPVPQEGIVSRPFLHDPVVAVAHPEHPLAGRTGVTLEELALYPFVDRVGDQYEPQPPRNWLAAHGVSITPELILPGEVAVRLAVRLGMGIALLSHLAIADDVTIGRLCVLDVEGIDLHYEFHLAWRRGDRLRSPVQAMIDLLTDQAALEAMLAPAAIPPDRLPAALPLDPRGLVIGAAHDSGTQ